MTQPTDDTISTYFLSQDGQTGTQVALRLADFIRGATASLDIAIYDFRLSPPLAEIVAGALHERAAAGVAIRIAYDADKPPDPTSAAAGDPAPAGTGAFVQSLGLPWRRIGGQKLMHNKYLIRDAGTPAAAVWTGSLNFTDDAWTLQENNVIVLTSAGVATEYAQDFAQLWASGHIEGTGNVAAPRFTLRYGGQDATVRILFSPASGETIDEQVALVVAGAQRRVRLCSMLLNSGALLNALEKQLGAGVPVDGLYDQTQMAQVLLQWQDVPHNHWKIDAVNRIVAAAHLVGKQSTPYSPTTRHDFMHDKIIVADDTVITGSYNFSRSAEENAENVLFIQSAALAAAYSAYIDQLKVRYS